MKIWQTISRIGIAATAIAPIILFAPAAHADYSHYFDIPCYGFGTEQVYCQLVIDPYYNGGYTTGEGLLHVYNGTNIYEWVFHLSCNSYGDQDSGANAPDSYVSILGCNLYSPINANGSYIQAI